MEKKKYTVPALEKGLAIIELLADSDQPLGITDLYTHCGIPKSSIFMILSTLESLKYIEKLPGDKYKLTMKIHHLGTRVLSKLNIRDIALPYMKNLSESLQFTVHLAALEHGRAIYIEKVNGPGYVQFSTKVGQSLPVYCSAVGKALAAFLPDNELDELARSISFEAYTPYTIGTPETFKEFLVSVRESGYAIEDEEGESGIRCIGAPIFDNEGRVTAAISVTALRSELPSNKFGEIGRIVCEHASLISKELGYVSE
ncbi:IclR family transcriptional regulator [Cohnella soli]|uniref:IclR family transcriptional regulator n=1 Tax=Cohnella soli TaxID=425005 RepID=A0ABW0HQS5_9BACL